MKFGTGGEIQDVFRSLGLRLVFQLPDSHFHAWRVLQWAGKFVKV
jgi:hypothetical protein